MNTGTGEGATPQEVGTGSATYNVAEADQPKPTITLAGATSGSGSSYTLALTKGQTAEITAALSSGTGEITATPGNSNVTVTKNPTTGKFTIGVGTSVTQSTTGTVTFSCDGATNTTLTVNITVPTAGITVSASPTTIASGGSTTLSITPTGTLPDYNEVYWTATSSSGTVPGSFSNGSPATIAGTVSQNQTFTAAAGFTGTVTITATLRKTGTSVNVSNSTTVTVSQSALSIGLSNYGTTFNTSTNTFSVLGATATATLTGTALSGITTGWNSEYTVDWRSSNDNVVSISGNASYYTTSVVLTAGVPGDATITATLYRNGATTGYTATIALHVSYNYDLQPTLTVSGGSHCLNDPDGVNNRSVVSYISYYGGTYLGSYPYVVFEDVTSTVGYLDASRNISYYLSSIPSGYMTSSAGLLSDVYFTATNTGTSGFRFNVYSGNTKVRSGFLTVKVTDTGVSSGDISYAANIGDTQYFNAADFENLYYDRTNGGSLSYVTFSTPSSGTGTLYADGGRLASNTYCYVSPSSRQTALDSVYFTPSGTTATRAGTVRIGFTAYGTGGRYTGSRTIQGTVVINYLNGNAKDITYTPVGGTINLKASDFTDKYREVVGSTAPTDLTIQFQDVPSNGSLSYKNSSNSSSSVSLRSSNIRSYRFTTRTSGANQIGDVTYTASGTRSDTISYIAYSGGTARFSGKVVFNPSTVSTTLTVTLVSSTSAGVDFNASSFTMANATVMASCSQIRFTVPTSGTLTYAGTAVGYAGVTVPVSMLGQIHYKPNAGFNNSTDRVAFICYDAAGNQIGSGQVNIVVSGNNTSTPGTGGVTSIGGFTDLPKAGSGNDWYFTELSSLVSRGIVQGTGNGKAEPRGKLTYGQALKMILLAAKYPAQTEVPGNDWAINYKNLAVQNGLISSSVVLTDYITRDAVAELAAKALKIQPVTGNSPFKDSTNGYAIALNRTSPQILKGDADGNFRGSSTLIRSEAWVIIYRMYEYADNQSSTQMPDGI